MNLWDKEQAIDKMPAGTSKLVEDMVVQYVEKGTTPSTFFKSMFEDKLMMTVIKADLGNQLQLKHWIKWMINFMPEGCRGSEKIVANWTKIGGLRGEE
jgi:hypothetical protein